MLSAQRTVVINRPPEEVFEFFTDPGNDPKWRPQVKEIAAQGPAGVGSTIHQVVAGPGGRRVPADIEVTAYEPSSDYAFRVTAGPVRPTGSFRFVPSGSGTETTFALNVELTAAKKLFLSKPVQRSMDAEMASLDEAKMLIESS
jgi:uncharacterized protein YndB with AHSA1/START domain